MPNFIAPSDTFYSSRDPLPLYSFGARRRGPATVAERMPVSLTIDPKRALVYSAFHGDVTEEELLSHGETIRLHPQFERDFSEIVDLRNVTELRVSAETLSQLAARASIFDAGSKHVVVAAPGLVFRLARTFQTLAAETRPNLKVVRTPEEAFDYLRAA